MDQHNPLKKRRNRMITWIILSVIALIAIAVVTFFNLPKFGSVSKGERLERVKASSNYRNGSFQNLHETKQVTSEGGILSAMGDFLFSKKERLEPESALPVMKPDLSNLDRKEDLLVWFGHSSYLFQIDGYRILVDPVFFDASPVSFYNKPFKGTNVFKPEDIPDIDFLVISHDHWDHLDYQTVTALKERIGTVVCGLGVGQHFERWGFDKSAIVEMDWNENHSFDNGLTIHCLPTRHFSGRSPKLNQSLWASYLIDTKQHKIYIGGDGGYDSHYADIGNRFEDIDLAILENGQYSENWKYIHLLPGNIVPAFNDLKAKRLFTVHHSKYALANHPWDEPIKNVVSFAKQNSINLLLPMIGEKVKLIDDQPYINKWWEGIE
ncbi:MBL fold metallo-hydrolase [Bacteroidales bacterium OttesenSCG-928-A17]|nr:MBL fold metallo-hydrolase [Bacteroidales bacterium OttesenSCG-928-A17]